jgi:hypothetical protein
MRALSSLLLVGLCAGVGFSSGCGKNSMSPGFKADAKALEGPQAQAPAGPEQAAGKQGKVAGVPLDRKIIFTGDLQVLVEDFAKAEKSLLQLVKANKGYVAQSEVSNSPGAPRSGRWKVRIPAAGFDPFRDAVAALGEVQKNSTNAQDVTDEFYDLQARVKNKQKEEQRLQEILQKSTGKLEDVLKVEEVLSRVREEIERLQGQEQRLTNLTSLTTLDVTLHERKSYVPPEAPGFLTSVGRTFSGSVDVLVTVGRGLALAAAALTPWLPVVALIAVLLWLVLRRRRPVAVRPAPVAEPRAPPG